MEEKNRDFIFEITHMWRYGDYSLGLNLSSMSWNEYREYYISISLIFWQIVIGFRI